jgi:thiol-disulfide isomerase/thioredoxin/ribosomal protein L33
MLAFSSWSQNAKQKMPASHIKGKVNNQQRDFILLRQQGRADTLRLAQGGLFEVNIEQTTGNYFTIEHGKQSIELFFLPADEIELTFNAQSFVDVQCSAGQSAPYIHYLSNKQKMDRMVRNKFGSQPGSFYSPERFVAFRDSIYTARINQLDLLGAKHSFVSAFKEQEVRSFTWQKANEMVGFRSQVSQNNPPVFPASYDTFLNTLNINEEASAYDMYYRQFMANILALNATNQYYANNETAIVRYYELQLDYLCQSVTSAKNKSVLISDLMPSVMKDCGTADLRPFIQKLELCSSDPKLIESVKRIAAQYQHLYSGQPAPDAVAFDVTGKNYKFSDFKGKVLYIDVWATWCGPCKREIPSLKQLEAEYHGKNVQFLSISTDQDQKAWENFLPKNDMSGLQLHQSLNFDESVSKLYMVNSIPRFLLIDAKGNIISSDAPRPSSGAAIHKMLDDALLGK